MGIKYMYLAPYTVPAEKVEPLFKSIEKKIYKPNDGQLEEYTTITKTAHERLLHLIAAGVSRLKEHPRIIVAKNFVQDYENGWNFHTHAIGVVLKGEGAIVNGSNRRVGEVRPGSVWVRNIEKPFGLKSENSEDSLVCLELIIKNHASLRKVNEIVEENLLTMF